MTVSIANWPQSLITQKMKAARMVGRVQPGSPAAKAGIKQGWLVLAINGEAADEESVSRALIADPVEAVFYDVDTQTAYSHQSAGLALGFDILPILNAEYGLDIRSGQVLASDWLKPWAAGELQSYAALRKDFEVALKPLKQNLLGRFVSQGKQMRAMLSSGDRWSKLGLALALMAQGNLEMSEGFARAYFDDFEAERQGGDPMIVLAAGQYVLAAIFAQTGEIEAAKELVAGALRDYPTAVPALQLYQELFGEAFTPTPAEWVGQALPGSAAGLNRYDPYEIWPHGAAPLHVGAGALGESNYGLVCVLGPYRSNGPFLDDGHRVAALQRLGSEGPAFVHVVTAWTGDPSTEVSQYRIKAETTLKASGLSLEIGYDAEDALSLALGVIEAPTWYVVGADRAVRAYGPLTDAQVQAAIFNA